MHETGSCQSPGSCPYHPESSNGSTSASQLRRESNEGRTLVFAPARASGNFTPVPPRPATLKVSRSRTTNESFRTAVDRSYDTPIVDVIHQAQPLHMQHHQQNQ